MSCMNTQVTERFRSRNYGSTSLLAWRTLALGPRTSDLGRGGEYIFQLSPMTTNILELITLASNSHSINANSTSDCRGQL